MCTPWHDTNAQTELFWHIGRSSVPDLLPMGIRVALRSGRRYETLAEPHARSMVTRSAVYPQLHVCTVPSLFTPRAFGYSHPRPRQIRTPLGPTRLHLGAYELHQVQPMASQCCMSSGRGHGFCIFELCELRVLPRGRLVGCNLVGAARKFRACGASSFRNSSLLGR